MFFINETGPSVVHTALKTLSLHDALPLLPFSRQFGTLLDSIGKPHINLRLTIISSIINLFFSYLGIINFGVIGAAYGTLLTYITSFIIIQVYLNINYKIIITDIFKASIKNYVWILKSAMRKIGLIT